MAFAVIDAINLLLASSSQSVTESGGGVWLLVDLKPIKRQSWWNKKFVLFWRPATWRGERTLPQRLTAYYSPSVGYRRREGATCPEGQLEIGRGVV